MSSNDNMLKEYGPGASIDLLDFIRLAVVLTEMVCREHQQMAVIGNLNPCNIKMVREGKEARLTGREETQAAYRSPEQSGRLNRIPDGRSDLYTLGVILYERLSGQLPLQPDADRDWETAHIFKTALPLSEIRPEWGGPISTIIMRLLAKSPDQRYQSAYGLLDDLNQCRVMLEDDGKLTPFELGRLDQARTFRWPGKVYGRESDLPTLESGLKQALQGNQAIRWVTGPEGSGKTALVHRFREYVVRQGGRFVEGRSVRGQEAKPYEPLIHALEQWLQQFWSEPVGVIERLKKKLRTDYGRDAEILMKMLPGMRTLLGDTAEKGSIPKENAWKRFGELAPDLIVGMAESIPPLVLFIDNMECADHGTHEVIRALAERDKASGLLLIGAFRTKGWNEGLDGTADEITATISGLSANEDGISVEQADLLPLCYEDVRCYLSDALHEESPRLRLLASSLFYQTGGNPGTIELLLRSWLQENKLSFDERRRRWIWDPEVIQQSSGSELNRGLMEADFASLANEDKSLLAMAAAIGQSFRLSILAAACECTLDSAVLMLRAAVDRGMIGYEDDTIAECVQGRTYLFLHDYIREVAYAFDPEANMQRHLTIGRLLQRRQSEDDVRTTLVAVDQLNLGSGAMSLQERRQLSKLNLAAGQNALAEGQYARGKRYAYAGLLLVEEEQKPQTSSVYVQLRLAAAWSEYMSGNTQLGREIVFDLKSRDRMLSRAERTPIWTSLIQFHTFVENDIAVKYAKEALAAYGWEYREGISKLVVMKEVMQTQSVLYRKRNNLALLPFHNDEEYLNLCKQMELCFLPLLVNNAEALIDLCARFIRYGIGRGMNESLAMLICTYSLLMQRVLPGYVQVVPAWGMESIAAADLSRVHRILFVSGMAKQLEKPHEASRLLNKALRRCVEHGDREFANIAMITCLITHNGSLYELTDLLEFFTEHIGQSANDKTLELVHIAKDYLSALQDDSLMAGFVAIPHHAEGSTGQREEDNYSCICKLEVAYLSGRYREALYWAKCSRISELAEDWARIRKQRLFEALTLASLYPEASTEESNRIRKALNSQLRSMKKWKGFLGSGSSAHMLVKAECERLAGNEQKALRYYLDAVKQARTEKYGLMEGIICERLAVCYEQDLISSGGATIALLDAGTAYSNWGVTSKVTQIRSEHANLLGVAPKLYEVEEKRTEKGEADLVRLHMPQHVSMKKPEASIGEEKLLQQLLHGFDQPGNGLWTENLLHTALRQSGADRGLVLRGEQANYMIEAVLELSPHRGEGLYADRVLRHVVAVNEPIVIHDAIQSYWIRDDYIASRKPRSILCMPFSVPGEHSDFFLYLENRHVPGVFTERDLKVLELIATRVIYISLLEGNPQGTLAMAKESLSAVAPDRVQEDLLEPLTKRELEILEAISEGMSNRDIAERLGITETTVKTHVSRIIGKLGVKRRGQAVVRANELQLLRK
ncbi:winged helix-turn-helix transcriptional regulator [Paenibacillus sp. 1011MAR3C5]|uniref:AAA family ATPase n=1 Tax=Paenibacillus sp. 1011MAR3C5 TaxID=1675787 RepID=UPI000E6B59A2|nr:AAA family ATPase [Paenibacillus sp. 1011MAR3C5]RJE84290.1 winged helix-turn-helix transcriptional regulator [Paenibacillus sp. 1011MAR3C5]